MTVCQPFGHTFLFPGLFSWVFLLNEFGKGQNTGIVYRRSLKLSFWGLDIPCVTMRPWGCLVLEAGIGPCRPKFFPEVSPTALDVLAFTERCQMFKYR